MKVYVNDQEVSLFEGAKVIDAVRAYARIMGRKLPSPLPIIYDGYGNEIQPDGALTQGAQCKITW